MRRSRTCFGPNARTASAAQTPESTPPETPSTAPRRPSSAYGVADAGGEGVGRGLEIEGEGICRGSCGHTSHPTRDRSASAPCARAGGRASTPIRSDRCDRAPPNLAGNRGLARTSRARPRPLRAWHRAARSASTRMGTLNRRARRLGARDQPAASSATTGAPQDGVAERMSNPGSGPQPRGQARTVRARPRLSAVVKESAEGRRSAEPMATRRKTATARRAPARTSRPARKRAAPARRKQAREPLLSPHQYRDLAGLALGALAAFSVLVLWAGAGGGSVGGALQQRPRADRRPRRRASRRSRSPRSARACCCVPTRAGCGRSASARSRSRSACSRCSARPASTTTRCAHGGGYAGNGMHAAAAAVAGEPGALVLAVFAVIAGLLLLSGASAYVLLGHSATAARRSAQSVVRVAATVRSVPMPRTCRPPCARAASARRRARCRRSTSSSSFPDVFERAPEPELTFAARGVDRPLPGDAAACRRRSSPRTSPRASRRRRTTAATRPPGPAGVRRARAPRAAARLQLPPARPARALARHAPDRQGRRRRARRRIAARRAHRARRRVRA